MWYFLTFYMQRVLGMTPLHAGFAFAPMSLAIIVGAQISSRIVNRAGVRPLIFAGTLTATLGFLWLSLIQATSSYWTAVLPAAVIASFAMGILFTPLTTAATGGVDRADAGLASGVLNTARQVGGSLGLAVLATVATSVASHATHPFTLAAATSGYRHAFFISAMIVLTAFAVSWMIPSESGQHH
jgi:MFS family permease